MRYFERDEYSQNNFLNDFRVLYDKLPLQKKDDFIGIVKGCTGTLLCCIQRYIHSGENKGEIYTITNKIISQPVSFFSLGYGLAGLGWMINVLKKFNLFDNIDEWLNDFETELEKCYHLMLYNKDLDYFRGASGILFYFLKKDRLNKEIAKSYIDCLYEREKGIRPNYYIDRNKNNINLGTPHGITGVILILLLLKEQGENFVDSLLIDLLEELLSFKKSNDLYYFPGTVSDDDESLSYLTWCYGDLMATYAILKAGILLEKRKYLDIVYPMLIKLSFREDCPNNLTLCHGYTSLTLVFRKMFEITNNKLLYNSSLKWQKMAIKTFYANFENYQKNKVNVDYFENMSLFYGFPGFLLSFDRLFRKDCESILLL